MNQIVNMLISTEAGGVYVNETRSILLPDNETIINLVIKKLNVNQWLYNKEIYHFMSSLIWPVTVLCVLTNLLIEYLGNCVRLRGYCEHAV